MGLPNAVWDAPDTAAPDWETQRINKRPIRIPASRMGSWGAPLPADRYLCTRCGIERECAASRGRPSLCSDCKYVLRYREPDEPVRPVFPAYTREEQLQGKRDYVAGARDPETLARNRSYERARKRERNSQSEGGAR